MNAYRKLTIPVLLVIHFVGSYVHAGKLYSWVDEDGQTQYGDRPPTGSTYTEKHIRARPGSSNTASQDGLRHGELDLLRKSNNREAGVMASRRAASKQYKDRKDGCVAAKEKHSDALRNSRSGGIENMEQAKKLYRQMRDVCF